MACNYSNKFLPLVISIAESVEWNKDLLNAELTKLFENPDVAMQDAEGLITFTSEQEEQKSTETRAPKRLNTKQATIGVKSGSSISSAYLGRSDAYSEMIKNFRRKVLEFARIKIDFNTGDVQSFDSNSDSGNGVSTLNRNLFEYKLGLIERILREFGKDEEFDQINQIINNAIAEKDWNTVDACLNGLIDSVGMFESVPDSVYDAYVILSNFDKLLEQECPYIEIDTRYGDSDTIHKYKYVGANVSHFTGWTSSEFANSMDQASMLVKAILDYVPETTENGIPIEGSSIGLSGFYSVMAAMRNTLLYHAEGELLQMRKELLKGSKVDMGKLIDAYIDYLQSESQNTGNVSSYYDTHKTYLIGKLQGIKDLIFGSNLDQELKDIFNNMFFKNVQMSYVAYSYDPMTEKFSGTDLKASAINQQTYGLLGTVASAIYNFRTNGNLFQKLVNTDKNLNPKYLITSKTNGYCTIKYKGAEFSFGLKEINTTFGLSEFKDIFFDLFGYILPDNYVEMGRQINGGDYDYKEDLGKVLRLGLQGVFDWGQLKYEETKNFPSNINSWLSEFAPVGKIISTIYGADTVNVIKNVSKKNNLPLFGLTSLAYNFPFIMWNHMDSTEDGNIYQDSFLFDKVDGDEVISRSIIGEPKIRSEVMCNGKLKSTSKLTVAEVAKLSILDDFFRNFTDKEVGHIYLQNATFADKGTHFLVNYNLDTPIYGEKTLRTLIAEQMKPKNPKNPNDTDLFRLMYNTRSARITQLVENILNDYDTVFPDGTFNTLSDINTYIKRNKLSHDDVRKAFAEHNKKPNVRKVNFYEEIHLSKGEVNETIALYYEQFTDETKLAERLDSQRKAFVDDLKTNRVKFSINSDSISKQIGTSYKKTGYKDEDGNDIEWVMSDGTIRTHIEVNGKTILHPVLEGYFMANDLLSNEYNEVMIGGVYSHSKNTESSRLIAQIKRSVIYGATMHSFAQGLENGVADEVKIACMPDVQAYVQNLVGTEQTNDSMDGSGLCTMLQARLESNSLLDARVGYDKKSIGHDIDSQYGRPSLLKWAVYAMTNARRRIAYGSNISQETLCKKAYSAGTIELDVNELNEILSKIGPVYFKDVENSGKYYKIMAFRTNPQTGQVERALQEVTANGTVLSGKKIDPIMVSNTLWDIDQMFGGAWAMTMINDTLEYSESNVDALEAYVIKHQDAKTKQIGYLVNKSAMKVGVGNLNTEESWTDGSELNTITMRTRYIGVQMDAEHHLDENEVTEMTQMISALSENGYTSDIVNSIYTDIGNVIVEALSEYDTVINSNDPQKLYKKLGEIFIKSFENNDRDTLGLAQAFVLKATKALKENDSNFRLPFSAETVSGLFVSTVSSLLTKKGIRRKYEGFAGVLTPSYNMMQYYRVGGQTMMYERFADLVREKGIVSDPVTGRSAVARAINDIVIDGELNPFLVPISQDQVDFEDTIVIFDADESGKPIYNPDVKPIYIQSYTQYDEFKHADLSGKIILNFTSRPKNLKATNTKFKVDGKQYSVYELDSVRAMFNFKNTPVEPLVIVPTGETAAEALRIGGINTLRTDDKFHFGNPFSHKKYKGVQVVVPTVKDAAIAYEQWLKGEKYQNVEPERRQWIVDQIMNGSLYGKQFVYYTETVPDASYGVDEEGNPLKYKYDERPNHAHILQKLVIEAQQKRIHKWIQKDLRSLNKGRGVMLNGHSVIGTDVQVTPAELITGRYHAKEFMMDSHENISDIVEKGEQYFVDKLTTKYGLTGEEPVWAETILFTETGERYLVRTVTENQRAELMRNGYPKDASVEEINGSFYSDENKITSLEGVSFHKYKDEKTGQVWKVILVDSEETKQKLNRSTFFDFYRNRYVDKQLNDQETIEWKQRINRRAKRMYASFEEQRKMLGTRIPTQAMQSFMPMEIIGYTDSLVNDVYVPVQQFFLQGSDLDIDKVYLLGYGINNSGKMFVHSKLADYAEYEYDELMELLPPNGREYELSEVADNDTYILDNTKLTSVSWINLINDIIKSGKSKVLFPVVDKEAKRFFKQLNIHTTTELSDRDVDNAIKNQVVHNVLKVASNVENQVIAQISVDAATVDLKKAGKKSHLAAYEKTITSDNPMTMFTMQVQNMVGREVIGVTAVALKQFFAKTAYYNDQINQFKQNCLTDPNNIEKYALDLWNLVVKKNPLTGKDTVFANLNFLDAIEDLPDADINVHGFTKLQDMLNWMQEEADKNDAALTISGILTLATDNAKELILSKLNATSALVDIYTYLTSLGVDTKTISDIMIPGSFTYIAKLQEGDLFNNFTRNITIDNAIKFYLGKYHFGINPKVLRGLFNVGKNWELTKATLDSEKVQKAIDLCLEAIKIKKNKEAEMREYLRNAAENGVDPSEEMESGNEGYVEPEVELGENGKPIEPPIPITALSTPEIYQVIEFLKECLERNENRKLYANKEVDANLTLLLTAVLPGVREQSMMGKMAGINQGLKTKAFDKLAFKQNIENYITGQYETYIRNYKTSLEEDRKIIIKELNKRNIDPERRQKLNDDLDWYNKEILRHETILENLPIFDLYEFLTNDRVQQWWIKTMDQVKHSDNILEIIVNVPHFKQMLHTWVVDETLLRKASIRYNLEQDLLKQIKPKKLTTYNYKDLEFNQVKQYVNEHLILNWMFDRGFSINIEQDQIDKYGIQIYDSTGTLINIPTNELKLDSITGIDSFKRLMETWIVPELKSRFGDNAFLQALTQTADKTKSGVKTYLKLPIPMMDIDKSVELETRYNQYLIAFDEISTQTFAGMKVADLFYLYNLIVNKDSFGQKSLTRIFENLVNSNKGSFLVNDYNQWVSELDASGDFSQLQMNIHDLKGRIAQYVPNTKIEGSLNGVSTPDSCFEVPNLARSPIRIGSFAKPNSKANLDVPAVLLFKNIFGNNSINGIGEDFDVSENTFFLVDMDYDTIDAETFPNFTQEDAKWLTENKDFLRKQKSFIYNGKLFVNAERAGIGDLVHEWAHIILSQMKWSDDHVTRDKYYEIVAKVSDHPRFDDIAKNYPWAHGSDLQEEVLTNLFQMYLQNKVFNDDNIVYEFSKKQGYLGGFVDSYSEIIKFIENTFRVKFDENVDLEDVHIGELLQLFGDGFYNRYITHDNSYVLKKHQKISAMKDKLVKEDVLKMICK